MTYARTHTHTHTQIFEYLVLRFTMYLNSVSNKNVLLTLLVTRKRIQLIFQILQTTYFFKTKSSFD